MGMDLVALDPVGSAVGGFHANWSGWSALGDLLHELGQDTSLMSGSNDGAVVPADTARAWGQAILDGLDRIVVVEYPDRSFAGGYRSELHVTGSSTPVALSAAQVVQALVDQSRVRSGMPAGGVDDPDAVPETVPLSEDQPLHDFVVEFARFLLDSGGFQQY